MKFCAIGDRLIQRSGQCIWVIDGDQPAGVTIPDHSLHTLQIGGNDRQTASQSFHDNIGPPLRTAGKDEYIRLGKTLRHIGGRQGADEREAGRHTT